MVTSSNRYSDHVGLLLNATLMIETKDVALRDRKVDFMTLWRLFLTQDSNWMLGGHWGVMEGEEEEFLLNFLPSSRFS